MKNNHKKILKGFKKFLSTYFPKGVAYKFGVNINGIYGEFRKSNRSPINKSRKRNI